MLLRRWPRSSHAGTAAGPCTCEDVQLRTTLGELLNACGLAGGGLGRDTRRCCYERRRRYIGPCMQVRCQSTFLLRSSPLSCALCGHLPSPMGIDHAGLRRFPGPLSALKTWPPGMRLPCTKDASAFLESRTHEPGFSVPRGTSCRKFLGSYHPCGWC